MLLHEPLGILKQEFLVEYGVCRFKKIQYVETIPDEALVIRGGRNLPDDIRRGTGTHPSGVTGISVECALGVSVEDLAVFIPHGQLGCTTVGKIRQAGGEVIRTST